MTLTGSAWPWSFILETSPEESGCLGCRGVLEKRRKLFMWVCVVCAWDNLGYKEMTTSISSIKLSKIKKTVENTVHDSASPLQFSLPFVLTLVSSPVIFSAIIIYKLSTDFSVLAYINIATLSLIVFFLPLILILHFWSVQKGDTDKVKRRLRQHLFVHAWIIDLENT